MNRVCTLASAMIVAGGMAVFSVAALADEAKTPAKPAGLWLTTDFPELTERIGDAATISLTLSNSETPPARVELSVEGLPSGWTAQLRGDGKPVAAAMVDPDQNQRLQLKVTPPKDVKPGSYAFTILGKPATGDLLRLPISMTLAAQPPARITLDPKLPALRGAPHSNFDFEVSIKNDSPTESTVNLLADAPPGFVATFMEQYGTQELTSLPFKAGETKTLKLSVKPPSDVAAGKYPVEVAATGAAASGKTNLTLDITGQPSLAISGPDSRLSGQAEAGKETTFNFTLANTGAAPARNVTMAVSAPGGWNVVADPKSVVEIAPDEKKQVAVRMTPSDKAIAGDYMVTVRASGEGASSSADFRVMVTTSTAWGLAGLGVIGAALVVFAVSVTRYGRR